MSQETSHYTVLARRFRPQQFDEVVGQQHVAQSLQNAIRAGRVAHAYLFTGARGVGKTSMARILAKALNCPNAADGVPCNDCEICDGISSGNDVDILEIDGASNRGIDDIRALRANVSVKSMRTRYKVYIVDEVHMLTREAFNALLKTLEEPPPGVKFVFCTTEPNKVPDTILSRCQRFDFTSINTQRIAERLTEIAAAEGVEVEAAAVDLVARRAAGSMRDSQSLFDQLLAFGGEKLTAADVHRLLGTADDDRLLAIFSAIVKRDSAEALAEFDRALDGGVQPGELINQLLACGRDLMVLAAGASGVELIGVSEANRSPLSDLSQAWGLETIVAAMQVLGETRDRLMRTTQSRALAELAIVRLAILEDLTEIARVIGGAVGSPSAQKKTTEPPRVAPLPAAAVREPDARREPETSREPEGPREPETSREPTTPGAAEPREYPLETQSDDAAADSVPQVDEAPQAASSDASASVPAESRSELRSETRASGQTGPTDSEAASVAVGQDSTAEDESSPPQVELVVGNEESFHAELVDSMKDTARDHLSTATLAISGPNQVALTFSRNYHFSKQYCERPDVLDRLQKAASSIAGKRVRIRIDLAESGGDEVISSGVDRPAERPVSAEEDAFVQEAVAIFRATVVRAERH